MVDSLVQVLWIPLFRAGFAVDIFQSKSELELDITSNAIKMPVPPPLERKCVGYSATFIARAIVGTAREMRFNLVGLAPRDIDLPAICFPTATADHPKT